MQAGRLRHRVQIQEPVESRSAVGEALSSWATYAEVHAAVEPISSRELLIAGAQVDSETTHRVLLRYLPGLLPSMRVKFGDRLLAIRSIINRQERDRELELLCVEGVSDGR